jgi:hypothetical protein
MLFNAFFNKVEIDSMRDAYVQSNKTIANETIEEIDKSTKEINEKLSNFCINESKCFLNTNNTDVATIYLDTMVLKYEI